MGERLRLTVITDGMAHEAGADEDLVDDFGITPRT